MGQRDGRSVHLEQVDACQAQLVGGPEGAVRPSNRGTEVGAQLIWSVHRAS
jgi:hypothetical protein